MKYDVSAVSLPANESLPARGAWIEIKKTYWGTLKTPSLPARGAWIEITTDIVDDVHAFVAPREGSVD